MLGHDGQPEGDVVQRHDAVGDVEDEGVVRLVGARLDVVQPVLVDGRLVEDVHLGRQVAARRRRRRRAGLFAVARFLSTGPKPKPTRYISNQS